MKLNHMKTRLIFAVVIGCWMTSAESASAQLDFLKGLLGGRATPAQTRAYQPFRGHQALIQAVVEAESGDLAKSL